MGHIPRAVHPATYLMVCSGRCGVVSIGVKSNFPQQFSQEVALMETPKAPDAAGEMTLIGKLVVIKGELSCSEDLYKEGHVEGSIDPKETA